MTSPGQVTLLDDLAAAVGAAHMPTDGDLSAWEVDWRRRSRGKALAGERPADTAQVAAVVKAGVFDAAAAHGGSISAEQGIGALKRDELTRRKSPVAMQLMRAVTTALDPRGLLNPGKVLDSKELHG